MHRFLFLIPTTFISTLAFTPPHSPSLRSLDDAPVLHFTLNRRGGAFQTGDLANLTYLTEELQKAEGRFNLTRREAKGNRLVRKVKEKDSGGREDGSLIGEVGLKGKWYTRIAIGSPPQYTEMDLDMLLSDFYVVTTSSRKGSRYDDFFSQTNVKSNGHPYPTCSLPTDDFLLPTINTSISLAFSHCRPPKSSLGTLLASGSMLGLAPSEHLSQTKTPGFFKQLLEQEVIERPVWSLMLINGQEGVLSVGGTGAGAVELVAQETTDELDRLGQLDKEDVPITEEINMPLAKRTPIRAGEESVQSRYSDWENSWQWSNVQGAEGFWQILMQGVWVNRSKMLKNQPVVLDISTPFILAPPLATKAFYASISGSRSLPPPYSHFHTFPCLNPPTIHFEFGGWTFPALHGGTGKNAFEATTPGGRFSLGRLREGSGYCVGAVVETRMGVEEEEIGLGARGSRPRGKKTVAGNGMRDVWVIGEGFFRGVGGVFDFDKQRVGFRSY